MTSGRAGGHLAYRCVLALAAQSALLASTACWDGGDTGEPTAAPSAPPATATNTAQPPTTTATATAATSGEIPGFPPAGTLSGIPAVDAVIVAAVEGRVTDLAALTRLTPVACAEQPMGVGSPPKCKEGESDGQELPVLLATACEGFFIRPEELTQWLQRFVDSPAQLYAVFAAGPQDVTPLAPPPAYGVVLGRGLAANDAQRLFLDESGRIIKVDFNCNRTPAGMVPPGREWIVAPPE